MRVLVLLRILALIACFSTIVHFSSTVHFSCVTAPLRYRVLRILALAVSVVLLLDASSAHLNAVEKRQDQSQLEVGNQL